VAVIEVALFGAALCLAPALSRVLRFGPAAVPEAPTVVLFDGLCGLCTGFVRFALRRDRLGALRFAPLQGPTAARLLAGEPAGAGDRSTVVVVVSPGTPEQRVLRRSAAVLRVMEELGGRYRPLLLLHVVPACLRDLVYDRVAAMRHRVSGRLEACLVPDERDRPRFLD
jgi:predicted DCC family thiol-disulfide oxidoreductase YuxK